MILPRTMSITSHFGYLGSLAACDTETALWSVSDNWELSSS